MSIPQGTWLITDYFAISVNLVKFTTETMKHDGQHYFSSIWHLFFSHFPSNSELVRCNFNWMLIHNCSNKYIKLSVYSNNLCSLKISGLKTLMSVDGNLRHNQCCHPNPKFGRCAHARVLCRKGLFRCIYKPGNPSSIRGRAYLFHSFNDNEGFQLNSQKYSTYQ